MWALRPTDARGPLPAQVAYFEARDVMTGDVIESFNVVGVPEHDARLRRRFAGPCDVRLTLTLCGSPTHANGAFTPRATGPSEGGGVFGYEDSLHTDYEQYSHRLVIV